MKPSKEKSDSFQTKIKAEKPFFFRVRIAELNLATMHIKLDLKSIDEVTMVIQHESYQTGEPASVKHIEIPFSVTYSTKTERPSQFADEY